MVSDFCATILFWLDHRVFFLLRSDNGSISLQYRATDFSKCPFQLGHCLFSSARGGFARDAGDRTATFRSFSFSEHFHQLAMKKQDRIEAELQQARDDLERKVIERTKELTAANDELKAEISKRKSAESLL